MHYLFAQLSNLYYLPRCMRP
uniref:Uncharacterized protein n=1 Tax=Arundo donax TaxID=35708 RepID=A0A0A9H409_ARUDO